MRRLAVDVVLRLADPVRERLVHERVAQRPVEVRDRSRDVVGEQAQLDFLGLERVADANVVLDVRHHGERAADAATLVAIGEQRNADPARLAVCAPVAALPGDRRPRERALDVPLQLGERFARQHFADGVAEQVIGGNADPVAERLVGETDLELAVEVEDRRADAVDDEPQPVLALARLELDALDVVDVGVGDEEAADLALRRAVRVVVDADPDRRPARRRELSLEIGPLAVERGVDVRVVERVDLAPDDLDHLVADDFLVLLGDPGQERGVREPVALVAVDVGERQAERVQLALRQRSQALALERLRDRPLDGRELEPIERTRQCHGDDRPSSGSDSEEASLGPCRPPRRRSARMVRSNSVIDKQGSGLLNRLVHRKMARGARSPMRVRNTPRRPCRRRQLPLLAVSRVRPERVVPLRAGYPPKRAGSCRSPALRLAGAPRDSARLGDRPLPLRRPQSQGQRRPC